MKKNESGRSGARVEAARRVTLDDVARRTGLHRTTVSQVLNGRRNCWASKETRRRIREAVNALGYRPNSLARALRSGRTYLLGYVSPGFGTQSPRSRAGGLTEAAGRHGYTVTLASHPNDSESEDQVIRRLVDRGADGLAVYPTDAGSHRELQALVARNFPVVTFDGASLLDFETDDIHVDYAAVGRAQVRHLLQLGRRRICLSNTQPEARSNAIREAAVRDELQRAGAPAPLDMRVSRPASREIADADPLVQPIHDFLAGHLGLFDAVIGFDAMASLAIRVLRRLGVSVPGEVAVVGSGNTMLASYGAMPLTSVCTADDQAGAKAFVLLMDRIQGRHAGPFRRVTSPVELIARESTVG